MADYVEYKKRIIEQCKVIKEEIEALADIMSEHNCDVKNDLLTISDIPIELESEQKEAANWIHNFFISMLSVTRGNSNFIDLMDVTANDT